MRKHNRVDSGTRQIWRSAAEEALQQLLRAKTAARDKAVPVDDLIRVAEKLRAGELLYWQLAENLQEVLWVGTPDWGKVLYVNPAYERLWGRSRRSLYENPMSWIEAVVDEDRDRVMSDIRVKTATGATEPEFVEYRIVRPDGSVRWILARAFPIADLQGQVSRIAGLAADVTDLKQTEQHLRVSEMRLRSMLDLAPVGIVLTDAQGDCLFVNKRWCDYAGLPAEAAVGQGWLLALHPDDRDLVIAAWNKTARTGCEFNLDYRFLTPEGNVTWLAGSAVALSAESGHTPGYLATVTDITERKNAEDKLKRSERSYRTLAENLTGIVYRVPLQGEGQMVFFNNALERLTGYTREELAPGAVCSIEPLIVEEDRKQVVRTVQHAIAKRKSFEAAYRLRCKNGEVRYFSERGKPVFDEDGLPLFIDGVIFDVTDQKQMEEALRKTGEALELQVQERTNQLNLTIEGLRDEVLLRLDAEEQLRNTNLELGRRAEQLSRLTSELTLAEQRERYRLGQVLHDHLQQLLVGAKFGLNFLLHRVGNDQEEGVRQVEDLLDECIKVSRSLAVELYPPILHQAGLIAGLDWLAGWMREKHGLIVELRVSAKVEPNREDVRVLLFQSVRELLLNVVKHAHVTRAHVEIGQRSAELLTVTVEDQGRGFDAVDVGEGIQGVTVGFGLHSIRERLAFLGGCLEIHSSPGGGTRCLMIAPLGKTTAGAQPPVPRPDLPGLERRPMSRRIGCKQKIRLLLADDHVVMREGLSRLLKEYPDLDVVGEASDGLQALQLARELQPDIVLMDLNMPGLNGIDSTRLLHAESPSIKVIGLSMYEEQDRARAMYDAGATAYLTKTGNPDALLETIHSCVVPSSQSAQAGRARKKRKTGRKARNAETRLRNPKEEQG